MKHLLLILNFILLTGCASSGVYGGKDGKVTSYYCATKIDVTEFILPLDCDKYTCWAWPIVLPMGLIDLPISLVADTIAIPFIYANRNANDDEKSIEATKNDGCK